LTIAAFIALSANLAYSAWNNPSVAPTGGNVPAPINVGSDAQVKSGQLGVSTLTLLATTPYLYLGDTNNRDYMIRTWGDSFTIVADRNDDNVISGTDNTVRMFDAQAGSATDGSGDWFRVANQVRANEYCDRNGADCFTPGSGSGLSVADIYTYYFGNVNGAGYGSGLGPWGSHPGAKCADMSVDRCVTTGLQRSKEWPLDLADHTLCFSGGNGSADENEGGVVFYHSGKKQWVFKQLWWHGGSHVVHCI
jgi:hypothetical protein